MSKLLPPKLPTKFLQWFCKDQLQESVLGDLEEQFEEDVEAYGPGKARRKYAWNAVRFFRPGIMKGIGGDLRMNHLGIFKHNLKTAFRVFKREKAFTVTNILGLSLGIWCALMVSFWVLDEFRQDRFHEHGKNLCLVLRNVKTDDGTINNTAEGSAYPIGDALMGSVPEISNMTRYSTWNGVGCEIAGELTEVDLVGVDMDFFDMFSFLLKIGQASDCLNDLQNMVISEDLAELHFPDINPVGQTISINAGGEKIDFRISGVFEKIPAHSSLKFDVVIPIDNFLPFNSTYKSWGNSWMQTFVLLNSEVELEDVNQKIGDLPKQLANVEWFSLMLQPFQDHYLFSGFENGKVAGGRIDRVIMFVLIGSVALVIACFNFINLTTARSNKRSREIGIRKVIGARKRSLVNQFLTGSTLLAMVSGFIAVFLAQLSLPWFNEVAGKNLSINYLESEVYLIVGAIVLVTVLFSGIYPAYFLSSFKSLMALKNKVKGTLSQVFVRKGLVTFQFCLSIILMAGTMVVFLQLEFLQKKDLGLDKENVIYAALDVHTGKHKDAIVHELKNFPGIQVVSSAESNFIDRGGQTGDPVWEGKNRESGNPWFYVTAVDFNMIELLDLELKSGRTFNENLTVETKNYLVNEKAAEIMQLDEPVGKSLEFWGEKDGQIVGVVKDFHFHSLHSPIEPLIIRCRPEESELLFIKTEPGKTRQAIDYLQTVHDQFSSLPLSFHFLDEAIDKSYKEEQRLQNLVSIIGFLAVFLSCMGLFGLVSYAANLRSKEMAVRKVLGAKVIGIMNLLFKEYFKLIIISMVIGIPIVHYWVQSWLNAFTYHITIEWWLYLLPGIFIILIAILTVGELSFKTATANPVDFLRDE